MQRKKVLFDIYQLNDYTQLEKKIKDEFVILRENQTIISDANNITCMDAFTQGEKRLLKGIEDKNLEECHRAINDLRSLYRVAGVTPTILRHFSSPGYYEAYKVLDEIMEVMEAVAHMPDSGWIVESPKV